MFSSANDKRVKWPVFLDIVFLEEVCERSHNSRFLSKLPLLCDLRSSTNVRFSRLVSKNSSQTELSSEKLSVARNSEQELS